MHHWKHGQSSTNTYDVTNAFEYAECRMCRPGKYGVGSGWWTEERACANCNIDRKSWYASTHCELCNSGKFIGRVRFAYGGGYGCPAGDYLLQSDGTYYCQSCNRYLVPCGTIYVCKTTNTGCGGYYTTIPSSTLPYTITSSNEIVQHSDTCKNYVDGDSCDYCGVTQKRTLHAAVWMEDMI